MDVCLRFDRLALRALSEGATKDFFYLPSRIHTKRTETVSSSSHRGCIAAVPGKGNSRMLHGEVVHC